MPIIFSPKKQVRSRGSSLASNMLLEPSAPLDLTDGPDGRPLTRALPAPKISSTRFLAFSVLCKANRVSHFFFSFFSIVKAMTTTAVAAEAAMEVVVAVATRYVTPHHAVHPQADRTGFHFI